MSAEDGFQSVQVEHVASSIDNRIEPDGRWDLQKSLTMAAVILTHIGTKAELDWQGQVQGLIRSSPAEEDKSELLDRMKQNGRWITRGVDTLLTPYVTLYDLNPGKFSEMSTESFTEVAKKLDASEMGVKNADVADKYRSYTLWRLGLAVEGTEPLSYNEINTTIWGLFDRFTTHDDYKAFVARVKASLVGADGIISRDIAAELRSMVSETEQQTVVAKQNLQELLDDARGSE